MVSAQLQSCLTSQMAYQVLARKWRPQNFSQLVGQEHVSQALANALQHQRLHHAYLFTGTRGVGKTTIARIFSKAINCENLQGIDPCESCSVCLAFQEGRFVDLIEVDAASRTKVDETRELLENIQYAPHQGQFKVYLIDEVHMLSTHSFNALLKTLEEPPDHVKFLLATTDPQKIPVTILSRCLQFNLKRLLAEQIAQQMSGILSQEQISFEDEALETLSQVADGSLRDGLSLLDQAISFGNQAVLSDQVNRMLGIAGQQPVRNIFSALIAGHAEDLFSTIEQMAEFNPDYADVLKQILRVLHQAAMRQMQAKYKVADGQEKLVQLLVDQLSSEAIQLFYQIGLVGQKDLELAPDPQGGFEMVMLRMLVFRREEMPDIDVLAEKKDTLQNTQRIETAKSVNTSSSAETSIPSEDSQSWFEIVSQLKIIGNTRELAMHCVLDSLDENSCQLSIGQGHSGVISQRAETKLEQALQDYFARPIKLKLSKNTKTNQATPADKHQQMNDDRQNAAVTAINEDENIKLLKQHFDSRIIPGSIKPQ